MEKYLVELIKENNRVILPNFGAFIIGREAGLSILFNNFLTFNDGLLINFVAKEEELSVEVASEKVTEFVAHLKSELEKSGIFIIPGIGTFTKDGNSIVRFQMEQEGNVVNQIIPEKKVELKDKSADLLDFDTSGSDAKVLEVEASTHSNVDREPLLSIDNQEAEVEKPVEKVEPIVQKVETPIVETPIFTPQPKVEYQPKPEPQPKVTVNQTTTTKKDAKLSPLVYVAIVLLLLIGGASVWYFYFYTQPKVSPVVEIKQTPIVTDSLANASKPAVEPKKELPGGRLNRIVVGVFQSASVADGFIAQLKSRGYNESTRIDKDGAIYVIINSFASLQEAEDFQQVILEDKIESWIITQ